MHLNDTSYISGKIYGDIYGKRKDGSSFKTGFVKSRMETSEYTLVFVGGNSAYVLYRREQLLK